MLVFQNAYRYFPFLLNWKSWRNEKGRRRVGNTDASGELQEKQIPKAIYNFYFPYGVLSYLLKRYFVIQLSKSKLSHVVK